MKIRIGFVSNSSSSSFLIGTNNNDFIDLMEKSIPVMFEGIDRTKKFMENIAEEIASDLLEETERFDNINEVNFYLREECCVSDDEMDEELETFTDLFSRWKHVYLTRICDSGEGGSAFTAALRYVFPHEWKNDLLETKYWG